MSADPTGAQGGSWEGAPGAAAAGQPSEDELRAAYEAELSRITATDMMAQSAVSLLNIGARRLGAPGEGQPGDGAPLRDLEQVRDAIDGARALLEILGRRIPQELAPLRDALSRLQMAYAREVGPGTAPGEGSAPPAGDASPASGTSSPSSGVPAGGGAPSEPAKEGPPGPGPAESSGRLWVPGR